MVADRAGHLSCIPSLLTHVNYGLLFLDKLITLTESSFGFISDNQALLYCIALVLFSVIEHPGVKLGRSPAPHL